MGLIMTGCVAPDEPVAINRPYIVFENVTLVDGHIQFSYDYCMRFSVHDSEPFEIHIDNVRKLSTNYQNYAFIMDITSLQFGQHTITYSSNNKSIMRRFDIVPHHKTEPGTYTLPLYGTTY